MKAKLISKFAYECSRCGETHTPTEKIKPEEAWSVDKDADWDDETGITANEPTKIEVYRLDCNETTFSEDQPEELEAWQCSECEEIYLDDKDSARECCKE